MFDSERLKKLMEQHDMTIMELSREAKVSHTLIGNLLHKEVDPRLSTLQAVARVFRVPVSHLLGENTDGIPPAYFISVPKNMASEGALVSIGVKFV